MQDYAERSAIVNQADRERQGDIQSLCTPTRLGVTETWWSLTPFATDRTRVPAPAGAGTPLAHFRPAP